MLPRTIITLSVVFFFSIHSQGCATQHHGPFVLDLQTLEQNRTNIEIEDSTPEYTEEVRGIIDSAEEALSRRPRSVVEKGRLPPSGDIHDYMSQAPYWWPDPDQPDGLPYIRRDGRTNPERRKITDQAFLSRMSQDIHTLGLAWFYTSDEKYAAHAAELLRVWFLNEDTRMNPNLNFAQGVPGLHEGRSAGLIETRAFVDMLDGVELLAGSKSWTRRDHQALQGWFREYAAWMQNSPIGMTEAAQPNNHGTAYDMQLVCFALFIGDKNLAKRVLNENASKRMEQQFEEDGRQPYELRRTQAWSYSISNLNYWFRLARLAEHVDIDLWTYETLSGKSIGKAYRYLEMYAIGEKEWDYEQIRDTNFSSTFRNLTERAPTSYQNQSKVVD